MKQQKHLPYFVSPTLLALLPPAILALITALVYYPSLNYEFQFDDIANISKHFHIRHYNFSGLFFSGSRWISYWLNSLHYSIGKFDPFSYRAGNMLIHMANGLLLFFVCKLALSKLKQENFFKIYALPISFVTGLLFLLHPVQTQTVSYVIQGQLEGLSSLFILSMLLCLIGRERVQNIVAKTSITALLFILALFSCGTKEIAVISPLLLITFDWFFIAQGSWRSLVSRWWLHAGVATLVIGTYLWLLKPAFFTEIIGLKKIAKNNIGNVITHNPLEKITPWKFFISQFKVIVHYLWMFIWPFGISVEYDWKLVRGFFSPDCIAPLLLLLGIMYSLFLLLRSNKNHVVGFGLVWFFLCIAPRSSIIPSPELLVDYKTYLASAGWLLVLACLLVYVTKSLAHKAKDILQVIDLKHSHCAVALALAAPLSYWTIERNHIWRSGLEFWDNMIKNAPGKARAYNNYGVELSQNLHKFQESIPYFKKAINMDAHYPDPHNNLAVAYSQINKIDLAIDAMKNGLRINPYYPEGYNNLASFYLIKKDSANAKKMLQTALKLRPYYGKAFFNLGRVALDEGDNELAFTYFKKACTQGDLDNKFGFEFYGKAAMSLKKYDEAIIAYSTLLQIQPNHPEALFNLANAYFLSKQFDKAQLAYKKQLQVNPQDVRSLYNLGETLFSSQQYNQALQCFEKLAHLHQKFPHVNIRRAACYEKLGKPDVTHKLLCELNQLATTPEKIKKLTHNLIAQVEKAYPHLQAPTVS